MTFLKESDTRHAVVFQEDLGMSFAILKHMRDQFKVNVLAVEYPGDTFFFMFLL